MFFYFNFQDLNENGKLFFFGKIANMQKKKKTEHKLSALQRNLCRMNLGLLVFSFLFFYLLFTIHFIQISIEIQYSALKNSYNFYFIEIFSLIFFLLFSFVRFTFPMKLLVSYETLKSNERLNELHVSPSVAHNSSSDSVIAHHNNNSSSNVITNNNNHNNTSNGSVNLNNNNNNGDTIKAEDHSTNLSLTEQDSAG